MTYTEILEKAVVMQEEIKALDLDLKKKAALYKAFTKEHFDLADGDTTDILSLVRAIKKIVALEQ